jgi:amidase
VVVLVLTLTSATVLSAGRVVQLTALAGTTISGSLQSNGAPTQFNEMTVAQLQAAMAAGQLSSFELTNFYVNRILALDQGGPGVNSVIELNPDALSMAQTADNLRAKGQLLGPLHGIPVLLKDNINTGDKMQTTAGSFALAGKPAIHDSTVAAKLRAGGAVILGKTNLSEWANFRSFFSTSGWSGRGGLTHNPYSIDRNACGSSSGSAAAASANFAAVSIGTETDGSIVCPANVNSVVGLKPASPAAPELSPSRTPRTPSDRTGARWRMLPHSSTSSSAARRTRTIRLRAGCRSAGRAPGAPARRSRPTTPHSWT